MLDLLFPDPDFVCRIGLVHAGCNTWTRNRRSRRCRAHRGHCRRGRTSADPHTRLQAKRHRLPDGGAWRRHRQGGRQDGPKAPFAGTVSFPAHVAEGIDPTVDVHVIPGNVSSPGRSGSVSGWKGIPDGPSTSRRPPPPGRTRWRAFSPNRRGSVHRMPSSNRLMTAPRRPGHGLGTTTKTGPARFGGAGNRRSPSRLGNMAIN